MGTVALIALLGALVGALGAKEDCSSGAYTTSGECCQQCQPGEGMVQECGATQTVCAQCRDSETFSDIYSHTESCQPCTQCTGVLRMQTPCTDSNDAICMCEYGYFMEGENGLCKECTLCPVGTGMVGRCEHDHDTICEDCPDGTFSDQENSLDPCLPCNTCEDNVEVELYECTSISDTVCKDLKPPIDPVTSLPSLSPSPAAFTDIPLPVSPTEDGAPTTISNIPEFNGLNEKLIPIYCSILAAVVLGVLAFIIFKRWNSYKQNKQGANNRTVNQTPSPEGEKLHSDSGISVDTQSLQEQQQQQQTQAQTVVVKVDGGPVLALPPHKREEVEKLLNRGCGNEGTGEEEEETDWCNLAGLLGYEEEHIATFRQEERPIRALLSDWASKDCASVDALCTALRKINRDDVAQSLAPRPNTEPTATSAV
ncbi:hypothetical protein COCON_G00031850 [Conger conger]|uniref:Tumor necrosis factor receptor superfamily member 16 n=1 Tax=Conger conger TaxID=82655 RepID=A0A9Q1DYS6_CONCO|nr:tumor necrosis factor receptor superfamily member 16-like [Conger conger]KAJ8284335.1 hypothetical protein COCON_G00031850 [Conger conger]